MTFDKFMNLLLLKLGAKDIYDGIMLLFFVVIPFTLLLFGLLVFGLYKLLT